MLSQEYYYMKKQLIILGITILIIFSLFCGCTSNGNNNSMLDSESKKFVGTWKHGTLPSGIFIIFSSNGNCEYLGEQAKWELKNEKLEISYTKIENELIFDYEFLDNDQILILTEIATGQVDDYRKQ